MRRIVRGDGLRGSGNALVNREALANRPLHGGPVDDRVEGRAVQRAEAVAHVEAFGADLLEELLLACAVGRRVRIERHAAAAAHLDAVAGEGPIESAQDEGDGAWRVPGRVHHLQSDVAAETDAFTTTQL